MGGKGGKGLGLEAMKISITMRHQKLTISSYTQVPHPAVHGAVLTLQDEGPGVCVDGARLKLITQLLWQRHRDSIAHAQAGTQVHSQHLLITNQQHTHTHAYTHAHTCRYVHTYMQSCTQMCMRTHTHACTHTHTHTLTCVRETGRPNCFKSCIGGRGRGEETITTGSYSIALDTTGFCKKANTPQTEQHMQIIST